jgi:teichoic acid transport system permease protein
LTVSEGSAGATAVRERTRSAVEENGAAGAELAKLYGLTQSGKRPPLHRYLVHLWQRRHFIVAYASAKNRALYSNARLGQMWQLLTPALNVLVYWLIFGKLLGTSRGVYDFVGYLVIGVFVFNFTQTAILGSSRSIPEQIGVIRSLHFPRACLPLATTVIQLQQLMFSLFIVVIVMFVTGITATWHWVLVIPVIALQFMFNAGLSLGIARLGATFTDMSQLLPFLLRTWMYTSGIFYSIATIGVKIPAGVRSVFDANPGFVYVTLVRHALMGTPPASAFHAGLYDGVMKPASFFHDQALAAAYVPRYAWLYAIGWAIVIGVGGLVYFWKAEEQYGRG